MRQVNKTFRNDQLVLRVSETVDPQIWNETRYAAFLDVLCGPREYQKRAILTVLRFLLGGRYQSLSQLAEENFNSSDDLKDRYGTFRQMEQHLLLPDRLYCTLDLATGTGKSYVLYGLAMIMLAEGHVDQVLVLCPSNTIEGGLIEKFNELAAKMEIRDALPDHAKCKTPSIVTADQSITKDSICVENFHAILEHVQSSIRETLAGKGTRTLVLSDEIHHVQSEVDAAQKRWREFLADEKLAFRWLVGVSGTCYLKDEYFADVVSRYSLRQAIEDGVVKNVDYVDDSDVGNNVSEQNQIIYDNHKKNRATYGQLKPLTIVVTRNIGSCEEVAEEWIEFLAEQEQIDQEQAAEKVLVVTSANKHAPNLARLKTVDKQSSKVEWIFSVSMLSEGWDVKNVFQIVPHEERAFNSKLLISQVLGRGLRVPPEYPGKQAVVTVFNHDSWSNKIRHLVNEILELEKRIVCRVDPEKAFHFDLHQIDYTREAATKTYKQESQYNLLKKGFVDLPSQSEIINRTVEYTRVGTDETHARVTTVQVKMYMVDDVARHVLQRLQGIDEESASNVDPKQRTSYAKKYGLAWCKDMVRRSLHEAGEKEDQVSEENRQKILQSLGPLYRGAAKTVRYQLKPKHLRKISTKDRQSSSLSITAFQDGNATFFYTDTSGRVLREEELSIFAEAISEDSELPRKATVHITNEFHFKSPLNLVFSTHEPERKFIRKLIDPQNASGIDAWIKSADREFYSIEYSWKVGEHTKRGGFNPDFFIKKSSTVYVVEVKDDGQVNDPDEENKKKYEFGKSHFDRLNKEQGEATYQFHFLSPMDFDAFFQRLQADDLEGYQSHLDVALRS